MSNFWVIFGLDVGSSAWLGEERLELVDQFVGGVDGDAGVGEAPVAVAGASEIGQHCAAVRGVVVSLDGVQGEADKAGFDEFSAEVTEVEVFGIDVG